MKISGFILVVHEDFGIKPKAEYVRPMLYQPMKLYLPGGYHLTRMALQATARIEECCSSQSRFMVSNRTC